MMQIVYFCEKDQFLTDMESREGEKLFITPSPAKADALRLLLQGHGEQDVVTIAKFTSSLINALWTDGERPEVKRKADLLLIFGILKKKYLPELGFEQFTQAYNLFSDLRSFSTNEEPLSSVMDEQPEEIRKAVNLFWRLLEVTGYLDEHGAYQRISEALRSDEDRDELRKTYVFWGFQHLNGQQVDLLKALALRYDVVIPFPYALKDKLKRSDWISWIKDDRVSEKDLILPLKVPKATWLSVNSREISMTLKYLLKPEDQVILGVSKLSFHHLNVLPSQNVNYKIPHQLVQGEVKEVFDELKLNALKLLDLESLKAELQTKWLESRANLKKMKAIQLFTESIGIIQGLTDENIKVDGFFLKLLNEVVNLNQPRTSYVSLSESHFGIHLSDMSSLEEVKPQSRVLLCVDERFDDIQSLGQNYTESIQKALSALGPLKRNELELLFKHWEFKNLFTHSEVIVLMGESTLKHSLIWKRLFTDIELVPMKDRPMRPERTLQDHLVAGTKNGFNGSFSASKFQTYQDCPRKFYFSYVEKLFPQISLLKDFDSLISGTIIHEIIEKFHKRGLPDGKLASLTTEVMQQYIRENNLQIPRDTYLKRELIFNHRASNGIQFLRDISSLVGNDIQWKIEEEFKLTDEFALNGKIDCLGIGKNHIFLLDFKSTKFAASSTKDVEEFESLQLWAYALAASKLIPDFDKKSIVLGYVVLDNPTESNLLLDDEMLFDKFKEARLFKYKKLKDAFHGELKKATDVMVNLSLAIQAETVFAAKPRKPSACHYCELTKVCVKSELNHV